MRTYQDAKGEGVILVSINGRDTFHGLIEGTPRIIKRRRAYKAKQRMEENSGVYFPQLSQMEKDWETTPFTSMDWPPQEYWEARLEASTYLGNFADIYKYENKNLSICWYAENEDPFQFLKNTMASIDFDAFCVTTIEESYDMV